MFVGMLLLVPILHPEILHSKVDVPLFVHLPRVQQVERIQATHVATGARTAAPRAFVAPREIPHGVSKPVETEMAPALDNFGTAGPVTGQTGVMFSDLIGGMPATAPPVAKTPAPVRTPPSPAGTIHVSQGVQEAKLIFGPKPLYPVIAKSARVQGTVRIQAVIAPDGMIGNLKVMSGPPLLINAAIEAVSRWRYQPTLLNGQAVEVLTEIDVIFTLGQ
jgi:protein TonB